jgi:trans-aconitate methyltransferase
MIRRPEPEIMLDQEQSEAYFNNDRDKPKRLFGHFHIKMMEPIGSGSIVDLGCGPGDLTLEVSRMNPDATIHGIDASPAMLGLATSTEQVSFKQMMITDVADKYDRVISSMTLHHIHEPLDFWNTVKRISPRDVFVFDMVRPKDEMELRSIVEANGPFTDKVFKLDFENSLRACFTIEEITEQLAASGLNLTVDEFRVMDFAKPTALPIKQHNLKVAVIHGALE